MLTNALIFCGLFTFYSASVLYANWSGFRDGMEKGRSLSNPNGERGEQHR